MTIKAALKHEGQCYLKDAPKGWRRAGAKSHYQFLRAKRKKGLEQMDCVLSVKENQLRQPTF